MIGTAAPWNVSMLWHMSWRLGYDSIVRKSLCCMIRTCFYSCVCEQILATSCAWVRMGLLCTLDATFLICVFICFWENGLRRALCLECSVGLHTSQGTHPWGYVQRVPILRERGEYILCVECHKFAVHTMFWNEIAICSAMFPNNCTSSATPALWITSLRMRSCSNGYCSISSSRNLWQLFVQRWNHVVDLFSQVDLGVRELEWKFKFKCFGAFSGPFYGKLMEKIGLKTPRNYSASFWTSNFSFLLLENLQTSLFMLSGFLGLVGTRIYGLNMTK